MEGLHVGLIVVLSHVEETMREAGVAAITFEAGEVVVWNAASMGARGPTLAAAFQRFQASGWGKP